LTIKFPTTQTKKGKGKAKLPKTKGPKKTKVPFPGVNRELLVRIHFIIVMIRWTGLAPWEFEFHFPGSLASTFLVG